MSIGVHVKYGMCKRLQFLFQSFFPPLSLSDQEQKFGNNLASAGGHVISECVRLFYLAVVLENCRWNMRPG